MLFAVRSYARQPAFAAAVILITAFAIGANSTIFTLVNAVLLRPLPYAEPDRLVALVRYAEQFGTNAWLAVSKFFLYRDHNVVLENLGA